MAQTANHGESGWSIVQGTFNPAAAAHDATLFALANGVLGVRGGLEELDQGHATILAEAFVSRPLHYHERFPGFAEATDTRLLGPGVTAIHISIDGAAVDFSRATVLGHQRTLSLRSAALTRETVWALPGGHQLRIGSERLVPANGQALCASRITIEPLDFAGRITIGFPLAMTGQAAEGGNDPRIDSRARFVAAGEDCGADALVARFVPEGGAGPELVLTQRLAAHDAVASPADHREITADLAPGQSLQVDRRVLARCNQPAPAPLPDMDLPFAAMLADHQQVLDRFWQTADLALDGDEELTRAIRYNLLHLFMSASRVPEASIAAKGLTGEGYEGHCFWDTEVFVLPVLALLQPTLARTVLAYRIARLDRARANARALGHRRGALYPWRTIAGDECSAHYPTGAAQYHVNAAVAYALEVYAGASGDMSILAEGGVELLIETARLWFDLGHFSQQRDGQFVIHGVTGPDEYTALVDNDFYTNAMARRHLRYAAQEVERLRAASPAAYAGLAERLAFDPAELADWRRAADLMWLPVDPASGVHPQDDTFMGKPDFPGLADPDRPRPLLLGYHPMVLYRHRLCKQGDVIQAHHVAGLETSLSQLARDFAYYAPVTSHDSTLSMTAFGCAAARLGLDGQAQDFHRETALIDIADLHGNSAHGAHMAAMAGSWLILAQGWAGLHCDGAVPEFAPRCPANWRGYRLRMAWRGSVIELRVDGAGSCYRLIDGPELDLLDHGRPLRATAGGTTIARPGIAAVIFDLDGVLTDTAEAHFHAWKRLCAEEGIPFDRAANEALKGVDRKGSLERILAAADRKVGPATFTEMLSRKNGYYRALVAGYSPANLFPGVRDLLVACQRAGLKLGLASASRNAADLIARLGIAHFFDHVADASQVTHGKPDPEIFVRTAQALGVAPAHCVGIEDAQAGVSAIKAAGMTALGVGDPAILAQADQVFAETRLITLASINAATGASLANEMSCTESMT